MRQRNPGVFPVRSLFTAFWLQALLLWAISAPLFQVQRRLEPASLGWLDVLGLGLFAVGCQRADCGGGRRPGRVCPGDDGGGGRDPRRPRGRGGRADAERLPDPREQVLVPG
jgi:hypothetical protein